jgi:site-specific DNA-cytosine methylase
MLRAIDICCGAGGWAVAAKGLPIKITHVFDREIDCLLTYKENFPEIETHQCDVIEYDFSHLRGQVDLILAGIPCEQLSVARANHKLKDNEKQLFSDLVDKLLSLPEQLDSKWWCFEDVIQLKQYLPPYTDYFELNSEKYSPQRRRRLYVGNLPKPVSGKDQRKLKDCLLEGPYRIGMQIRGREPSVSNNYAKEKTFYPWSVNLKSPTVVQYTSNRDHQYAIQHGDGWRHVDWKELALLQGFPKEFIFWGSPQRVVKMIAQAVQIDTGRAILEALCRDLKLGEYHEKI